MSAPPSTPSIQIAEGTRPESGTHVRLEEWEGPLGLLLSLIEARQLDVLSVPLGALAGAYLEALARVDADRLGNISAFVSVASQLILIKSRAMLPRQEVTAPGALPDEGPDPEAELRARLLLYRAYRDAGGRLADEATARVGLFRREPTTARAAGVAGARPPVAAPLDPIFLVEAIARFMQLVPPPEPPPEVMARTVTLAERAAVIRQALAHAPTVVLQDLLLGVRDRVVVTVTFLAMLELVKRREIVVEQAEPWGPIVARQTTVAERAAAGVNRADDEPLDESLESFA